MWPDYDTSENHSVCIKAPSIYIIMARLARITGLEWSKMYENSTVYWFGVSKMGRFVDDANHTYRTRTKGFYIPRKFSGYPVYT